MFGRIKKRINTISTAGKISVIIGCAVGTILMLTAIYLSCASGLPLEYRYLREQMGSVAAQIFAIGVCLGLMGDYFLRRYK